MKTLLKIDNLKKVYHDTTGEIDAVKNVTVDIHDQEFLVIVGPSGCGKSTILSVLAKLEEASSGNIEFNKDNLEIGYMLQDDALFPWLTILENCFLGLKIKNIFTEENKQNVIRLLENYGLIEFKDKYPSNLSGGMRQRVLRILYTHRMITYKWLITLINKGKEVYYVIR